MRRVVKNCLHKTIQVTDLTPPRADREPAAGNAGETPPAASVCPIETLRKRSDFIAASRARRQSAQGLLLQARRRREGEAAPDLVRVGYTCSKKVGNAVARNRAKRRLREVARAILPTQGKPGWDYVLIGRALETENRPFHLLLQDMETALKRIHAPRKPRK